MTFANIKLELEHVVLFAKQITIKHDVLLRYRQGQKWTRYIYKYSCAPIFNFN